uniref:Uncharacterized protein n=1 Tax=Panagrolaimus sp. PS1159 TaxID=55785 RepID=A0AC35G5H1_9BILA
MSNTINNSTLSLQIAAYENSNEADALNVFGDENIEGLKEEKFGSIKTSKQCFTDNLKSRVNPFEFPRQENEKVSQPEVSQYKASQRLLNDKPKASAAAKDSVDLTSTTTDSEDEVFFDAAEQVDDEFIIDEPFGDIVANNRGQIEDIVANNRGHGVILVHLA